MESSTIRRVDFPSSDIPNFSNFDERQKRATVEGPWYACAACPARACGVRPVLAACSTEELSLA